MRLRPTIAISGDEHWFERFMEGPHSSGADAGQETVAAETQGLTQVVGIAGQRLNDIAGTQTLGLGVLSALRKLLAAKKGP